MTQVDRSKNGRFVPGQSGNPGGRPKTLAIVQNLARSYTETSIKVLGEIMEDEDERGATRIAAIQVLLDRGWGRPLTRIDVSDDNFENLTNAELEAFIVEKEARLEALGYRVPRISRIDERTGGSDDDGKTRH